jgi:glyoxylase-like metal-dependent hydrolase (beta-lactamase superfamily II)
MLSIKSFTFNPFAENTYLLIDSVSKETVLIDPGAYTPQERAELKEFIVDNDLTLKAIWLTHAHIDHVMGLAWALQTFGCPYYQTEEDLASLRTVPLYAKNMFGIPNFEMPEASPTLIDTTSVMKVGSHDFTVLSTPGHALGHVAYYNATLGVVAGYVLFAGSIGRTDLPVGDIKVLEHTIKTQLYVLPENTVVYPGHGPATTVGQEKRTNPYVRA